MKKLNTKYEYCHFYHFRELNMNARVDWHYSGHWQMSRQTTKPTKLHVRPAKTQISLGIRPAWSESSLSAWRKLGSLAIHWVHSEDSDQTGRMPRLIWVFAGRTCHFVGFVMRWLKYTSNWLEICTPITGIYPSWLSRNDNNHTIKTFRQHSYHFTLSTGAVAGQRSSTELRCANKTKMHLMRTINSKLLEYEDVLYLTSSPTP